MTNNYPIHRRTLAVLRDAPLPKLIRWEIRGKRCGEISAGTRPMIYHPQKRNRRSVRLKGYDYSQPGAYASPWSHRTGMLIWRDRRWRNAVETMGGNRARRLVQNRPGSSVVVLYSDDFVIMPNHIHGMLWIADDVGATRRVAPTDAGSPLQERWAIRCRTVPRRHPSGAIIAQFKSIVTKRVNEHRKTPGVPVWQRNYHERIIRNEESVNRIRLYVVENPLQWACDRETPDSIRAMQVSP